MNLLQKWHESLKTDRESIYFSDTIGHKGILGLTTHMAFLSNRRLVFVQQGPFSVLIQTAFIREIRGMRLIQRRVGWIGATGMVLIGIAAYLAFFGLSDAIALSKSVDSKIEFMFWATGSAFLTAFLLYSERRVLLDVNGLAQPLSMRWQGNHERFLKFANDLTYHRSLWEDAGKDA